MILLRWRPAHCGLLTEPRPGRLLPDSDAVAQPGLTGSRFRPARAVVHAGALPVALLRAGRETPEIAATVEAFVITAKDRGARLEPVDVPNGHHGFETLDVPEEIRPALRHAMPSVVTHLTS